MPEPRLETAALIGKGFCSDVYAWGEGRALKVFHGRVAPVRTVASHPADASRLPSGLVTALGEPPEGLAGQVV